VLDLFPDPTVVSCHPPRKPSRYLTVYLRKKVSRERPATGSPSVVHPGDIVTFFNTEGQFTTWVAGKSHAGHVEILPMIAYGCEIEPSVRVKHEDIYEIQRPVFE
jgi:hypothetical protein